MVAAGSVVAAVQGLYLKSQDASLSSENLTNFLSQVIRSDPVCKRHITKPHAKSVEKSQHLLLMLAVWWYWLSVDCVLAGLLAVMSGADRVSAGVQPAAGSAAQRRHRNQTRGRGRGPVLHPDRRQRHQHLKWRTAALHLMTEKKLRIEGGDGWAGRGLTYLKSPASPPSSSSSARWAALSDVPLTCTPSDYDCHYGTECPRHPSRPGPPCNNPQSHISWQWFPPIVGKEMNTREMYLREKTLNVDDVLGLELK